MKTYALLFLLICVQCKNKNDCKEGIGNKSFEISKIYFIRDSIFVDNDSKIKFILSTKNDFLNEYVKNNSPLRINIVLSGKKLELNQLGRIRYSENDGYIEIVTTAPLYRKNNDDFFSDNKKIFQSIECLSFIMGTKNYPLRRVKSMEYLNFEQGIERDKKSN